MITVFNVKLENKLLEQRILINDWHGLILNLNISTLVVIRFLRLFGSERELYSGSAL